MDRMLLGTAGVLSAVSFTIRARAKFLRAQCDIKCIRMWCTVRSGFEKKAKLRITELFGRAAHAQSKKGQVRFRIVGAALRPCDIAMKLQSLQGVGVEFSFVELTACILRRGQGDGDGDGEGEGEGGGENTEPARLRMIRAAAKAVSPDLLARALEIWRAARDGAPAPAQPVNTGSSSRHATFRVVGRRGGQGHDFSSDDVKRAAAAGLAVSRAAQRTNLRPSLRHADVVLRAQVHRRLFTLGLPINARALTGHNSSQASTEMATPSLRVMPLATLAKANTKPKLDRGGAASAAPAAKPAVAKAGTAHQQLALIDWAAGCPHGVTPQCARDVLTPLWPMPYAEQLSRKQAEMQQVIKRMARNVRRAWRNFDPRAAETADQKVPAWLEPRDGLAFLSIGPLLHCNGVDSDDKKSGSSAGWRDGYRNKCELVVGRDYCTGRLAFGFQLDTRARGKRRKIRRDGTGNDDTANTLLRVAPAVAGASCARAADEGCSAVHEAVADVGRVLSDFINSSALPPFTATAKRSDGKEGEGFWRGAIVRHSLRTGQLSVTIRVNGTYISPGHADIGEAERRCAAWKLEKVALAQRLQDTFSVSAGVAAGVPSPSPGLGLRSLMALYDGEVPVDISPAAGTAGTRLVPLWAAHDGGDDAQDGCIEEVLCGVRFRISPLAFFQVHTRAAEKLINTVLEYVERRTFAPPFADASQGGGDHRKQASLCTRPTVVLDVCCGGGAIGLCVAHHLPGAQVLGIEQSAAAVADARRNASLNGLTGRASFVCGKAEDEIDAVLGRMGTHASEKQGHVVAIVDPPRTGMKPSVCRKLRQRTEIAVVVVVSCNPHGHNMRWDFTVKNGTLLDNAAVLCGPPDASNNFSRPFRPCAGTAIDMFPETGHVELVVAFVRE